MRSRIAPLIPGFLRFPCLLALAAAAAHPAGPGYFKIVTVAGSSYIGDGGAAALAQIGNIQGVAVDHSGNIYLSDTDRNLVRKVDTRGIITTVAGNGTAGFSGDGGPATAAQLNLPYGLAADLAGNVYVADLGNNRVRRINPDGSIVTVAGTGVKGSSGDGGLAADAQLMTPRNVAVDAAGALYISEFEGHRIRKVTPDGKIATFAGTGIAGFRGDGGLAINAQIGYPAGLALDRSGALYLADSQNQRIRKILPGGVIATVIGGSTSTALYSPIAVAVDSFSTIYTADATGIVRSYTSSGVWSAVAGTGLASFSGDGGPANKATLSNPRDLATDLSSDLFIADGVRIREINSAQVIGTVAGDGYLHAVGDGSPALNAVLNQPTAVALDRFGNLFIADQGTQRIRQVLSTGVIQTFAGTGSGGYNADQIPAAAALLSSPSGVVADAYGEVLLADTGNQRIRIVGQNAKIATYAGTGVAGLGPELLNAPQTQLRSPGSVCISLNGTVYIVDTGNNRVLRAAPSQPVQVAAGNGSPGLAGDGGPARTAELNGPSACATDSAGDLFIADSLNHRIAKVTPDGKISTVAGTGSPGFSGDEGPAISAALAVPRGLAVDDNGDLFIADSANNRIRQVTPDGIIHTIAGTGIAGFGGDGDVAANALLNSPEGLFLDGYGDLFLADTGNNRVRILTPATPPPLVVTPIPLPPGVTVDNAASLQSGPVAPGELLTIYGVAIGPQAGVPGAFDATGLYANLLAGSEVRFDGVPAPIFYTQAGQINAQAPFTIAGQTTTHVEVRYQGQIAGVADIPIAPAAPAIFPTVLNQDGSLNSAANPAPAGGLLLLFACGAGVSDGGDVAGQVAQPPYPHPQQPVSALFAAENASILYAGAAPGEVGVLQVNLQIPTDAVSGPNTLQLTVGPSPAPLVTVYIQ